MNEAAADRPGTPQLLTVQQLATYLNVSAGWVRKGILTRTLPHTKLGKSVRFTPAQVDEILRGGAVETGPEESTRTPRRRHGRTRL